MNTIDDQSAKLATSYSAVQLNYLKVLLRGMFSRRRHRSSDEDEECCFISSVDALNAGRSIPTSSTLNSNNSQQQPEDSNNSSSSSGVMTSISSSNAGKYLDMFVEDGWLLRSRKGRYMPSCRLLLDLDQYLSHLSAHDSQEEDGSEGDNNNGEVVVRRCTHCDRIVCVYKGAGLCSRDGCGAFLHGHCFNLLSVNRNNNNSSNVNSSTNGNGGVKCLKCKQGIIRAYTASRDV